MNLNTPKYNLVCGLEVHAELKTISKMFCGCKNDPFHAPQPNIFTCPTCLGMPGGLPVANKKAIEWTIMVGLALGCKINLFSKFDRKNYFYPDLPKGYQISQYDIPFCYDGQIDTSFGPVRIHRIHLEEDTGKLIHTKLDGEEVSLIDFNRSGVPLIEIVTEPDIHSAQQAKEYAKNLRKILRYLDVADCDMDQGGMRLEANISLQTSQSKKLPDYKVEVKNINSFRYMEQAINYEIKIQTRDLEAGKQPTQLTKGFDPITQKTFIQRSKEEAADYRYFPDPDLPPIRFTSKEVEVIKNSLPELPAQIQARLAKVHQIPTQSSDLLLTTQVDTAWLDGIISLSIENKINPQKIVSALVNKKIEYKKDDTPVLILKKYEEFTKIEDFDSQELINIVKKIINENADAVQKYRDGQKQVLSFFIGQVMRQINKNVNHNQIKEVIVKQLDQD